nr:DNA polymerase IV [Bacteroidota bacterium]
MDTAILHLDLDSFFVSVERLNNASLIGKPVIVGGKSSRGVVAACSYEARQFGLHSAMPIMLAKRLCPHGIYISGDMESYSRFSGVVTDIIRGQAPVFEKSSIDEFYVDLSGMDRFFGCEKWAAGLRDMIRKETGLPISSGLSINKTVSKVATGEAKPDGRIYLPQEKVRPFLRPLPVQKLPMVGKVTHQFLNEMGIRTIGRLMDFPAEVLTRALGKNGLSLWKRANGIDYTPVEPYTEAKSMSTERTFHQDTADMKYLHSVLLAMVEQLGYDMRKEQKMTGCVSVKIRYSDFDTATQQRHLSYTSREDTIIGVVMDLFKKLYARRSLIRLVGIKFSSLVNANYQLRLFDDTQE